jgi:hypothetical protein
VGTWYLLHMFPLFFFFLFFGNFHSTFQRFVALTELPGENPTQRVSTSSSSFLFRGTTPHASRLRIKLQNRELQLSSKKVASVSIERAKVSVDAQIRDLSFCCKNLQKDLVHLKLQEDL